MFRDHHQNALNFIQILNSFQFFVPITPCVVLSGHTSKENEFFEQNLAAALSRGKKSGEFSGNNKAANAVWYYSCQNKCDDQQSIKKSAINSIWFLKAISQGCC